MVRIKPDVRVGGWVLSCMLAATGLASAAGDQRLADAAKRKDTPAVRALLKQNADVKGAQPDGGTALHWAAQWDNLETADLLIRAGADANAANEYGVTPLALACTNGSAPMISALLAAGAKASAVFPTGETPLMSVARTGRLDAVKVLLAHGADVKATEASTGQNALMWAAAEGHADIVRLLIEAGADVRAPSKAGFTPLLFAARTGNVDLARFLLESGADVNTASSDGFTALTIATGRTKTALTTFLLEKGADPNKGPGLTPLHWVLGDWADYRYTAVARSEGDEWSEIQGYRGAARLELVKLLLAHGANPNALAQGNPPKFGQGKARGGDMAGATPFYVAAKNADAAAMRLLLAAGANPMLTNNAKTTPLMVASGVGQNGGGNAVRENDIVEAVKLCVELGIDVNAANDNGETALHGASYRGIESPAALFQFLVDKGAKVNAKNKFGWTPLAIAEGIYYGGSDTRSDKSAAVLRSLGAEPSSPDVERNGNVARRR